MRMNRFLFSVLVLCVLLMSYPALADDSGDSPGIEPKADEILKQMSEYLGGVEQFTYHADAIIDETLEGERKLLYTAAIDVSVRRPDRLRVDMEGDLKDIRFWYDGKSATLLGQGVNLYATVETPPQIDAALEHIGVRYGATLPVVDFALSDPYAALTANVQSGEYVGLHNVYGVKCHHLAFTQEDIDWQIWVEDGRKLVPKMFVIMYKRVEGSPQYIAVLSEWDLSPLLPDSLFTFVAPEEAIEVEFLRAE
jgi:hypothetical protein